MDDRVRLSGLRIEGRHGVGEAERAEAQEFLVDVECPTDARAAGDDIARTLDYTRLAAIAERVVAGEARALIETLADEIAARVLEELGVRWASVRVTKLAPRGLAARASVSVRRERADAAVAPVELHVPDFAPVKRFYRNLGFEIVREEPGEDGYLVMRWGDNVLAFWPGSPLVRSHPYFAGFPESTPRGYGVEIVLVADDVDAAEARAGEVTDIVDPLTRRPWGRRDFRIVDPFGYYLRVTER